MSISVGDSVRTKHGVIGKVLRVKTISATADYRSILIVAPWAVANADGTLTQKDVQHWIPEHELEVVQ